MIVKILFTMLVIIVVGMIFRTQNQAKAAERERQQPKAATEPREETRSLPPKTVAYLLVALLILVCGVVYYFSWSDANEVVTLRVTSSDGRLVEYQAYRKDIRDREFKTIDGIQTRLADTDRLQMLVNQ